MNEYAGGKRQPFVSVVVLNYNGVRFLRDCFSSLLDSTYPNIELLLYDNNSTDQSLLFMKQHFPSVRLIMGSNNAGYSHAYNEAMQYVRSPYAVFLNNDTRVKPGWLEPLVEAADSDYRIAALQPKLLQFSDPSKYEYSGAAGGLMDAYGYPLCLGRLFDTLEDDKGRYQSIQPVFWVSGAAFFVRSRYFRECGGLDEDFVHHMEEIDLCWRFQLRGYRVMAVPGSVVLHHGGGTILSAGYKKMYWNHRNCLFMLCKNYSVSRLPLVLAVHLLWDMAAAVQSLLSFKPLRAKAILMAYAWLTCHISLIRKKRKAVQQMRIAKDDEVKTIYPGSIVYQYFFRHKKTCPALPGFNNYLNAIKKDSRIPQRTDGDRARSVPGHKRILYGDIPAGSVQGYGD
jgi:GT2 family glycosyltransferase